MLANIENIRKSQYVMLAITRCLFAIFIFLALHMASLFVFLVTLLPAHYFDSPLHMISDVLVATISITISFLIKKDMFTPNKSENRKGAWKIFFTFFVIIVVVFVGLIAWPRIQVVFNKRYVEDNPPSFTILTYGEIPETQYYFVVRKIKYTLDTLRSENQFELDLLGTPLQEVHLYTDHESFIEHTGRIVHYPLKRCAQYHA